jgi:TolA-binding protein
MSLLMEALRKAEEAKRRMQQEEQTAATGRDTGESPGVPAAASSTRREAASPFTLEDREDLTPEFIRDNFTTTQSQADATPPDEPAAIAPRAPEPEYTPEPEPSARNLARRKQRAAAASVFQAKQSPSRNRKTLTILVIVMVLTIPLGGGVLWYLQSMPSSSIGVNPSLANYDLSSRSSSDTAPPAAAPEAVATTAPGATTGTAAEAQTAAVEPAAPEATTSDEPTLAEASPPNAPEEAPAAPIVESVPEPIAQIAAATTPPVPSPNALVPAPTILEDASSALAPAEPRGVLEISRTRGTRQVNPDLVTAYESLQSGDLATASRLYQQLLDLLPNNRDALLGLALIHQRQNEAARARELYARLLQLNPRDALAQTGLLQTMQITDPAEHESALKGLIGQYPDVAQLTLALGNLYASQQRWSEAQGAYYNALLTASRGTGGPVNPDYAFNLAVSLEQLDKPKAALDYYRQAEALAREVRPGFDVQQLNSRLAHLEQAQP